MSACEPPGSGRKRRNWRGSRGYLPGGAWGLHGEAEGSGLLQGENVPARDSAGQAAAEMAEGSAKTERPKGTKVFVPLAMATEAFQEKLYFEALDFVSSLSLLEDAGTRCTGFPCLALLSLMSHCPQKEP